MAASPGAQVFYLTDRRTNLGYLVDTGACESLIPKEMAKKLGQRGPSLRAANGSSIQTFGKTKSTIRTPTASYAWQFLIADVFIPIIGADFLAHFDLLGDVKRKWLIPASSISDPAYVTAAPVHGGIMEDFKTVFSDRLKPQPKKL